MYICAHATTRHSLWLFVIFCLGALSIINGIYFCRGVEALRKGGWKVRHTPWLHCQLETMYSSTFTRFYFVQCKLKVTDANAK